MRWGPRIRYAHAVEMVLVEITDNKILRLTAWILVHLKQHEWEVYKTSYWSKIMCKAEWQKMRLIIWKFIIKTLSNKGLNRKGVRIDNQTLANNNLVIEPRDHA